MPDRALLSRVSSYEDLLVYQKLVDLHLEISRLTMGFPRYEMYELGSQLRRSSNSIPANLAEGWNNKHPTVYIEGINRGLGELRETRHHLLVAFRKGHIPQNLFGNLDARLSECGKMLRGLMRSLEARISSRSRTNSLPYVLRPTSYVLTMMTGAFTERLRNSWVEIRENLGRASLQALGVMLGVASVLGGFSISDSQRKRSEELYVRMGGLDKLNVQPSAVIKDGAPTALRTANLGLRQDDAIEGRELDEKAVSGVSQQKFARVRVRSPYADQERQVHGIGGDFLPTDGYAIAKGRVFTLQDMEDAAPVAILGSEALETFFPDGDALGKTLRIGDVPVQVVGVLQERVFRFRNSQRNMFRRRNRIVAVPATLVARRFQGDQYQRLDRVTFRVRKMDALALFSKSLSSMLKANHRQQEDFRLDDVAARIKKQRSQGDIYDMIFMLSGVLSLIGGGIVNVNIQMATLKERVREVGVKMAIGASGREVFKEFMTEALLLTALGSLVGLVIGVAFSKIITVSLGTPLWIRANSFFWAYGLATVFGFVFALYPAFKASRLSPMEALRYE